MRRFLFCATVLLLWSCLGQHSFAGVEEKVTILTVPELTEGIAQYEKKEVSLEATVVGACGSGCKIWVAEQEYKDGVAVALVWAKDKAFSFKSDAVGKRVRLQGYAVNRYVNLCSAEKSEKHTKEKEKCASSVGEKTTTDEFRPITFFATSIDYLD